MSTLFYKFASPITSVGVFPKPDGKYVKLNMFVNHQNAGSLIMTRDEAIDFLTLIQADEVAHRYGAGGGKVKYSFYEEDIDSIYVVSEYGEIGHFDNGVFNQIYPPIIPEDR